MPRDVILLDTPLLNSSTVAAGQKAQSMPVIEDSEWARLYPQVKTIQARCPLLWNIWKHQQGADADALIGHEQLTELARELRLLKAKAPAADRPLVESLMILCAEARALGRHIAFVAD